MSIKNGLARKRDEDWRKYAKTVRDGQRDFVKTGTALGMLRVEEHHKERGYASFEELVEAEFDMPKTTAYRLIEAARVVTVLSQLGTIQSKITNQAQALALSPVRKDGAALLAVVAAAEETGRITAASLEAARAELYPHAKVIDGEVVPEKSALVSGMRQAIEQAAAKTAEPMPVEIYRCEKCTKSLAEGIVKAAQRRCLGCDPNREHAAYEVGGPCMVCPTPCEACGEPVKSSDVQAGRLRCRPCDPSSQHKAINVDGTFTGECAECQLQARLAEKTSAAVTAGNTEDASPALGEPDVDEEAASTSGTPSSEETSSDGEDAQPRVDPVGSEPGYDGLGSGNPSTEGGAHGGLSDPADAAASALATEDSPAGAVLAAPVPVGAAQELQDGIEEGIGCDRCDFSLLVSPVDPDASLTEMRYHLRREHDLYGDAAGLALARVRTISPAADTSDTESQVVLQQPGTDSPTGREGGRSELDHHRAGVSGGEAPESPDLSRLPVGELGDGGQRALTPSSSDPREEPTATDRLLYAMSQLAVYLRGVDVEALAPTLFPNELVALHAHADEVAAFAGRIEKARSRLAHTP